MKLCIPTETDAGKNAPLSDHFGSAPFFTLYDTETAAWEAIPNDNHQHAHGACQPLAFLNDKNIDQIITYS